MLASVSPAVRISKSTNGICHGFTAYLQSFMSQGQLKDISQRMETDAAVNCSSI